MIEDFINVDVVFDYAKAYCAQTAKIKFHRLSGNIDPNKLVVCLKILEKQPDVDRIFMAETTQVHPIILQRLSLDGPDKKNDLFFMMNHHIHTFDSTTFPFKAFKDLVSTIERKADNIQPECQLCMGTEQLIGCIQCSAWFCMDCCQPSLKKCHACGVEFKVRKHKNQNVITPKGYVPTLRYGCMMQLLEFNDKINVRPFTYNPKIGELLRFFATNDEALAAISKYMQFERYITYLRLAHAK